MWRTCDFLKMYVFPFYPSGHVDDLFPFFLQHSKQIFPMLECMDDLRKISDLRLPPNWLDF